MKRSHLVVGTLCLLLGAVGAFLYPHHPKVEKPLTPNDSPVTVRGGSVLVRSQRWTKISNTVFQAANSTSSAPLDTSTVSLDGVPNGGTASSEFTQPNLANNWQLTLNFRLPDGLKDKGDLNLTKLFLCSKLNNAQTACDPTGPLSPNTLYLVTESQKGGTFSDEPQLDNYYRERYDLQICGNNTDTVTVRDSTCNHIFDIKVDGIPNWSSYSPFRCVAGGCDIGIGAPGPLVAAP